MDCEEFLEGYSDFFDGELEEHPFSEYATHLRSCPDCAEYHRVMRRGLRLLRSIDPPEPTPDFSPRLQLRFFDSSGRGGGAGEYTRALAIAGLTAVSLLLIAALPMVRPGGRAVELPPLVVEAPTYRAEYHALWGPPPTFAPQASLLRAPSLSSGQLFRPPRQGFSLFRRIPRDSTSAAVSGDLTSE